MLLLLHLLLLGDLLREGADLILHLEEYGLVRFSLLRVVLLHQIKPFVEMVFCRADLFELALQFLILCHQLGAGVNVWMAVGDGLVDVFFLRLRLFSATIRETQVSCKPAR